MTNDISQVIANPASGREALKISLFCYPNAPIKDLFTALQPQGLSPQNIPAKAGYSYVKPNIHAVAVYVPESSILPQIADYFDVETIGVGDYLSRDNLHVHVLPFLSQTDYDALLRDCDLNFVRGEDSWVRAIWAAKPFIWQPYVQEEGAHVKKLEAFLALFYADLNEKEVLCKAHRYWSAGQMPKDILNAYLAQLPAIQTHTLQQSKQLAQQTDLATKLVNFCNKL